MSLANFSFPFQLAAPSSYGFYGPQTPRSTVDDLRLNAVPPPTPAPSLRDKETYNNEPYITPAHYQQQHQQRQREQYSRAQESHAGHQGQQRVATSGPSSQNQDTRYANYNQDFRRTQPRQQEIPQQRENREPQTRLQEQPRLSLHNEHEPFRDRQSENSRHSDPRNSGPDDYPELNGDGYTRVNGGAYGSADAKTSVHAILDYDDDDGDGTVEDYYDDGPNLPKGTSVTPIQGPIDVQNGTVPVVPLYPYPQLSNGSFLQIPILWSALSVALGAEQRGDLVKGIPCIKKHNQLYCPTAGKTYPNDRIEHFIDENKALMKRMYGVFEMDEDYGPPNHRPGTRRKKRNVNHGTPDGGPKFGYSNDGGPRVREGATPFSRPKNNQSVNINNSETGRIDACESKTEIFTPYWAKNSAQKIRAIVNTEHFEQAIHQEVCTKKQTNRCQNDCGCEQKYKWHRLLAYDPDDDCKGIFMDWFIFPSCCVCRCDPTGAAG